LSFLCHYIDSDRLSKSIRGRMSHLLSSLPKTISVNVYLCAAQFVFMAESWWQMSDVANTWNGHWTARTPPWRSHPLRSIKTLGSVLWKHFANIPSAMRIGNRKYLWPAQHITHLISILVFLVHSGKVLSLNIYTAWLDFRHAFGQRSRPFVRPKVLAIFWWFHFCFYGCLIRLHFPIVFAKGLSPTNDCDLQQRNSSTPPNFVSIADDLIVRK